jgi:hypothetical protein
MVIVAKVIGALFVLMGIIWILQGINVLPGSFMTGQMQWAIYGLVAVVIGGAIIAASGRLGVKH